MILVVSPCFNEGNTIIKFLKRLESVLSAIELEFTVLVVDDGSQDNTPTLLQQHKFTSNNVQYEVLNLKFNSGHQNAIFQGVDYSEKINPDHLIIMDSDGEDEPEAIPLLLQHRDQDIVVVKRGKRSESILFKLMYFNYKMLFKLITGKSMNFGNFCMINKRIIERIKHTSFIHLPAYLLKQRANKKEVLFDRGKRIDGKSKLGYKGLLMHAFKSMIEFGEDLLLLFLKIFVVVMVFFVAVLGNILYQKFIAHTAILGWFSTLLVSLLILAILCLGFFILGVLLLNLMYHQNNKASQNLHSRSLNDSK